MIWQEYAARGWSPHIPFSFPNFVDFRNQSQAFEEMGALTPSNFDLGEIEPKRISACAVSASLFPTLRVSPMLGRTLRDEDDRPGAARVAVLSHTLWQQQFGADRRIIDGSITLSGNSYAVVGVMPPRFQLPATALLECDLWVPLAMDVSSTGRGNRNLAVVGRLRPGISIEAAQAEMDLIAGRLQEIDPPTNIGMQISVVPLHEQVVGPVRPALLLLFGAVAFVLLIACSNVAGMMLASSTSRVKEMAVRSALGARRFRLIQQLLKESILLSLAGGAAGLLAAFWALDALVRFDAAGLGFLPAISLDVRVLVFTLVVSSLTGIFCGLVPALKISSLNLSQSLKEGGRTDWGVFGRIRSLNVLVVGQIGLALVLLTGAGLMIKSFLLLSHVDPGFNPANLLTIQLDLSKSKYTETRQRVRFLQNLLQRIESLPGVRSAAATSLVPLSGNEWNAGLTIEGRTYAPSERPHPNYRAVSPGYFQTMGIPILRGRDFTGTDTAGTAGVAVINETAARRYFPGEDPLGKRIRGDMYPPDAWLSVVGVVGDVRHAGLHDEPKPEIYWSSLQNPTPSVSVVVRTNGEPMALAPAVRDEVWAIDSGLAVHNVRSMDQLVRNSMARWRWSMIALAGFAGVALLMAMLGIYGVMSYAVGRRSREVGIRMTVGGTAGDVHRLVLRQGFALAILGIALGLAGAFALSRFMASLLYETSATDPITLVSVVLLLLGTTLVAIYIPARRAAKVDPLVALRYE